MTQDSAQGGKRRGRGPGRTTRADWVQAALETLIAEGVDRVRVLELARRLECARSSFYWYFKNRAELLDSLLEHWQQTNTQLLVAAAARPAETINFAVGQLIADWAAPGEFDIPLDLAVRDWARRSDAVRRAVDSSDAQRIEAFAAMFRRYGYPQAEAEVRAQILYFHQFGYDALDRRESWDTRLGRSADYLYCLTGKTAGTAEVAALAEAVRRNLATAQQAPRPAG
ncbi:TetR/AcrR family transcriptional regulator [Pseudodonghicola flavimaris]|uniref:TetR/AcrR family transcriptional regulator n=1 Tax=Pseudodonghicola flavimaris TaxID=3050036 RepID=A0ABT7F350_9RHOB|nr:TetR/AcrR family transcriptional regulator [Pseudodonghicola flavimaris]MDK3019017.1 TetR/AcrR family transcriptional regulator [Pseudodonghicola flavimaris]